MGPCENLSMGVFAWLTMAAFVGLGVLSLGLMIGSLRKPAEPDVVIYFSARRHLVFSFIVLVGSVLAIAIGIARRLYYLLFPAPLLICYTLPIVVEYFRTREALKKAGQLPKKPS